MKKILVPLDGSALAQQALPHALGLARRDHAELVLLAVDEELVHLSETEHLTEYLGRLAERIRGAGWRASWQVAMGGAAEQIVQRAVQEKVDLIVMTSHGRRGLTRWVLGSVTERVARETPCALLVVRGLQDLSRGHAEFTLGKALAGDPPTYPRVLVPLDGSAVAERALETAQALAGEALSLLSVIDFPPPVLGGELPSGWAASVGRESESERRHYLDEVAGRLQSAPVGVDIVMRRGSAAEEIVETAAGADLVVMTLCSRPWVERAVTGSVASRVLRHSACPVLIVPGVPAASAAPTT